MRDNFPKALEFLWRWEGGYTMDPADPGGETNLGISRAAYPLEDIAGMTKERAAELYLRDYWLPSGCDTLPYPLDCVVFDCAVNMGGYRATNALSESRLVSQHLSQLFDVLYIGDKFPESLPYLCAYTHVVIRLGEYEILGGKHPRFKRGWKNRCYDLLKTYL